MRTKDEAALATGLVCDHRFQAHHTSVGHPEASARLEAVLDGIRRSVPAAALSPLDTRAATEAEILRVHTPGYVAQVRADVVAGHLSLSTGDTEICSDSYDVALLAVGAGLQAVDAVMAGRVRNAFCAVRPPGHHATRDQGMGFCIFNNVAIAARYAQTRHGIERVLIVDWDVHHGNGTQDIFYTDPSVYYFSTHQWPLYPGTGSRGETGAGPGLGATRNVCFPAGGSGSEALAAFQAELLPAMETFRPEFVFISAGFDAREDEPLSNLEWTDADFGRLTRLLMDLADRHAAGRLVSILEGGYGLEGLALAAGEHVRVLAGGTPKG